VALSAFRAGLKQRLNRFDVVLTNGPVDARSCPSTLRSVDIRLLLDQRADNVAIAFHHRIGESCITRSCEK
jgi:hypothetical protein